MKTRPLTLVSAALAAFVLLFNSGCVAVVAGAGAGAAVAYMRGDLEVNVDASLNRAIAATNRAIDQLQFAKVSENTDALVGTIVARNADDKRIEVRLEGSGNNLTKVRIRVGVLGDEALSMSIYEKIQDNL